MPCRVVPGVVLLALVSALAAQTVPAVAPEPALPQITRGQTVTVHGKDFPAQDIKVYLRTGAEKTGDKGLELPAVAAEKNQAIQFQLPKSMPTGRYLVYIGFGTTELAVPGDLQVLPDEGASPHLDSVYPVTGYRSAEHSGYDLVISGQGLAANASDNVVEVVGRGPEPVGDASQCAAYAASGNYEKPCLLVEKGMEGRQVRVIGFLPGRYEGQLQLRVRVGNNVSNALPVTFSRLTAGGALGGSIIVFVVITALVLRLVWQGIGSYRIANVHYSPLTSFFLDKETNSYSLSKFQLVGWTSVAIFGYLYLLICRIFVQWNFSLPPVPEGLPTLLAISAGTTVAAAGVTTSRGSKGSGPIHPSMADFISTGGLVVGERFQFFVWTLIGCFGFLAVLLASDPAALQQLPKLPDNFLYVMGISSVGYLGGKFARKPGPVIKAVSVLPVQAGATQMTVRLQGENLSDTASIKVDDQPLRPDQVTLQGAKRQDQAPDASFCLVLDITLPAAPYLEGEHTLMLVNPDSQAAMIKFPVDPMGIDSASPIPHGAAGNVTVKGRNFAGRLTAVWRDPGGRESNLPAAQVVRQSDQELTVTLDPGPAAGNGTLTLVSEVGLRASRSVTVS